MVICCLNCNKNFESSWSGRKYCSRSCSATRNNSLYKKRTGETTPCNVCGEAVLVSSRRLRCVECASFGYLKKTTLGEYRSRFKSAARCYNSARSISRTQYIHSDRPKMCSICQYNKHYEVCHIVDLHKLPDNTILHDALSNGNLIALCPNCHWEFDHDLL